MPPITSSGCSLIWSSWCGRAMPLWDAGYNALMVTDTSFMRNPQYHQPSDTIDTLDLPFLHQHPLEATITAPRRAPLRPRRRPG